MIFQATRRGTSTVMLPSALAAQPEGKRLTRIRVAGRVAPAAIDYRVEPPIQLKFSIEDPGTGKGTIPVVYNGFKPDMFAVGRDIIIDGEFEEGKVIAHKLQTQCPSKYEPPSVESMYKQSGIPVK